MVVPVGQTTLALDRQIKILDPLQSRRNDAATAAQGQCKSGPTYPQRRLRGLQSRGELSGARLAMVVAVIDHEPNAQRQLSRTLAGTGQEPPRDIGRIGTRFEPDPCLDANEPHGKEPDRDAAVEMKGLDMDMTGRVDRPAAPAVGMQRPAPFAINELRIGFDP